MVWREPTVHHSLQHQYRNTVSIANGPPGCYVIAVKLICESRLPTGPISPNGSADKRGRGVSEEFERLEGQQPISKELAEE